MGAFKIQTDLDLSGFNLLNFCIQSYTDLENVPNLGLGRKLFFTGNSTDEKNLREVIWNGVEWKAAAYLDDIEAITNGEGSLGTRVKALEDMLGLEDVTDVIDTWNDVKEFFANVDEGLNLMTMLDGKAEWNNRIPDLSFKHIGYGYAAQGFWTSGPALSFGANANCFGQIQMDTMPVPTIKIRSYNKGYGEWQTLIHTGNVGNYALKIDGSNIMTAPIKFSDGSVDYDAVADGLALLYTSSANNAPNNGEYGRTLSIVSGSVGFQLGISPSYPTLYYRAKNNNTWGGWKTIAFTDSDITGNAATATKLQTARTIWGQSFDGTQNLSGNIFLPSGKGIRWMLGEVELDNISVGTAGAFNLGYDSAINGYASYINGTPIYFRTGKTSLTTAMTITEEGNVVINTSNSLSRKLAVGAGGAFLYARASSVALGEHADDTVLIGSGAYGMQLWADSSTAASNIQAMNYGGTATAYALNLNPLGGAVNVGEGGLNVAGITSLNDRVLIGGAQDDGETALQVEKLISINNKSNNCKLSLNESSIYSVIPDNYAYAHGVVWGLKKSNAILGQFGHFLARSGDYFSYIGLAYNDTWFAINSTESNFNVLTKFNGGALIPTGQTLTIGSVTFRETAAGEVEVDGNLHTTGTLASGGKAAVGEGDNGGGGNANVYSDVIEGVITQEWEVGNPFQKEDVIVSLYMWNTDESRWEMVLADIGVTSENIWVTFGRPTSTTDKYMAVVMG